MHLFVNTCACILGLASSDNYLSLDQSTEKRHKKKKRRKGKKGKLKNLYSVKKCRILK
jgi:hypothetical protein